MRGEGKVRVEHFRAFFAFFKGHVRSGFKGCVRKGGGELFAFFEDGMDMQEVGW